MIIPVKVKLLPTRRHQVVEGSNPFRPVKKKQTKKMAKVDITKHEYVPKHTKLSEAETEKLLVKYNISKKQLPKILKKDPAIAHLDLKPGDVVKIGRKSPTLIESTYYRVVINA